MLKLKLLKFTLFVLVQFIIFKGCSCLNATQDVTGEPLKTLNNTLSTVLLLKETTLSVQSAESKETRKIPSISESLNISASINENVSEMVKSIFEDVKNSTIPVPTTTTEQLSVNHTIITNCMNVSSVNLSCSEQLWNDTLKTNYTTVAEAVESSEGVLSYTLQNSAAIAAGVFLISAVVGYLSCVGYRHFLQRKYGNSQILIGEEVYDTSDLRYFEI